MSNRDFWEKVFSGDNGFLSSKRVFGALIILVVLGCTIGLVIKEGGTPVVENLLTTAMIIGGSLLGLSSVTGIWRKPTFTNTTNYNDYSTTQNNDNRNNSNQQNTCNK